MDVDASRMGMGRNRLCTLAVVAACLATARAAFPDPVARGNALYLGVVSVGYGHLLGGALFARRRMRCWLPAAAGSPLVAAFAAASLVSLFGLYALAARVWPPLLGGLLALAVWHAFENDLVVARAYARGLRSAPLPRSRAYHATVLASSTAVALVFAAAIPRDGVAATAAALAAPLDRTTAVCALRLAAGGAALSLLCVGPRRLRTAGLALLGLAAALPEDVSRWLRFEELFAVWTLYHVVSWFLFAWDRARVLGSGVAGLVAVHAVPAALCATLLAAPIGWEHPLRALVFAPSVYLFWSSLHVAQTLAVRGIEARRARPRLAERARRW